MIKNILIVMAVLIFGFWFFNPLPSIFKSKDVGKASVLSSTEKDSSRYYYLQRN